MIRCITPCYALLSALLWVMSVTGLRAQEPVTEQSAPAAPEAAPAAGSPSTATPPDAAAAQAKAAFDKSFEAFKGSFREIEALRIKYQTADPEARKKINADLTGQLAHTQSLANDLIQTALEAYRLSPNSDPQIQQLLTSAARYETIGQADPRKQGAVDGGDQYEKALPIIEQLAANGAAGRDVYLWGFIAAFATGDYELARNYLQRAQQQPPPKEAPPKDDPTHQLMAELVSTFAPILDEHSQMWKKEQAIRAAEAKADDLPRVKFTTTKGDITIELFENEAPQSVANFLTLVKQGFYTNSPFHRVLSGFMAQGGAKTDTGEGGPGYVIRCECYKPDARKHFRGSLSMAHAGQDTGNSQFFLTFRPTPHLDGRHTVFGRVIDGLEVLGDLQRRNPQEPGQPAPDRILKAEVLRDRGHEYSFEKLPGR